jgi:serine/threonine protein kinase
MDTDLERAYNLVTEAVCAEDVFGKLYDPNDRAKKPEQVLEDKYQALVRITDPDIYKGSPEDKEFALEARERLGKFFEKAKLLLEGGFYGARRNDARPRHASKVLLTTAKRQYNIDINDVVGEGTISTVYGGSCVIGDDLAGKIAIKIADDEEHNDLIVRERRALSLLHAKNGRARQHLPVLLDSFQTTDARAGSIFRHLDEFLSLTQMRDRYGGPEEERQKHMVWMLNRALGALGYAHSAGIVHTNVEPEHLLFRIRDHNLCIVDWSWAAIEPARTADGFKIATERFSAPEVKEKKSPTPAADIYSIGKCMIDFLGGNTETNEMPDHVEDEIQRLLKYLVLESRHQRAQDAWQMQSFLVKVIERLWGRTFRAYPLL